MGIDKEKESERFSDERCRVSHSSSWFRVVYMCSESKVFLHDKCLRSFGSDSKNLSFTVRQNSLFEGFLEFTRILSSNTISGFQSLQKMAQKKKIIYNFHLFFAMTVTLAPPLTESYSSWDNLRFWVELTSYLTNWQAVTCQVSGRDRPQDQTHELMQWPRSDSPLHFEMKNI